MTARTNEAAAFAEFVMSLMDEYVPRACHSHARQALTRAARTHGLEIHQKRGSKGRDPETS